MGCDTCRTGDDVGVEGPRNEASRPLIMLGYNDISSGPERLEGKVKNAIRLLKCFLFRQVNGLFWTFFRSNMTSTQDKSSFLRAEAELALEQVRFYLHSMLCLIDRPTVSESQSREDQRSWITHKAQRTCSRD